MEEDEIDTNKSQTLETSTKIIHTHNTHAHHMPRTFIFIYEWTKNATVNKWAIIFIYCWACRSCIRWRVDKNKSGWTITPAQRKTAIQ